MFKKWKSYKLLAICVLVSFAILSLQVIPGRLEAHAFCGEWGCVPPLQSLVAQNGFWIALAIPIVLWAVRSSPPEHLRKFSLALALAAVIFLGIGIAAECAKWASADPVTRSPYWLQRVLLTTATCTLVPLPHIAIAAAACWWIARGRVRSLGGGSDRQAPSNKKSRKASREN